MAGSSLAVVSREAGGSTNDDDDGDGDGDGAGAGGCPPDAWACDGQGRPLPPPLELVMIILPIVSTIVAGILAKLRPREKWATCLMASYQLVHEIYMFRLRTGKYDTSVPPEPEDEEGGPSVPKMPPEMKARKDFVNTCNAIYDTAMAQVGQSGALKIKGISNLQPHKEDHQAVFATYLMRHVHEKLYKDLAVQYNTGGISKKDVRAVQKDFKMLTSFVGKPPEFAKEKKEKKDEKKAEADYKVAVKEAKVMEKSLKKEMKKMATMGPAAMAAAAAAVGGGGAGGGAPDLGALAGAAGALPSHTKRSVLLILAVARCRKKGASFWGGPGLGLRARARARGEDDLHPRGPLWRGLVARTEDHPLASRLHGPGTPPGRGAAQRRGAQSSAVGRRAVALI